MDRFSRNKKTDALYKDDSEFVAIGYIGKPYGIKGALSITLLTDYPEQFKTLKQIYVEHSAGHRELFEIVTATTQKNKVILKLQGIDTRNQAEEMVGRYIVLPRELCRELPDDTYFIFDLIGITVRTDDGTVVGKIEDIMEMPANDVYVVRNEDREYLIPAIKEVVKKIDMESREMLITPLEGLLE